ncbi:DUF3231 family protein [Alkalihalophilus sp. As8PL]|uniref:DUF3231 family protein n=1 Tax=Alkalihalophilus sp. As8PL TaxID=3237103 RepID=A0AB39BPI9_9BACI
MSVFQSKKLPKDLSPIEVSNIWSSYLKNSMELRLFEYFYVTVEDKEIKHIINKMLLHSKKNLKELKKIFKQKKLTVPIGFTEKDVKPGAGKLFGDTFMLYFCQDITLLSMTTYSSALSDCTNQAVRSYFQMSLEFTTHIQNEVMNLLISKGVYIEPPQVSLDPKIEVVESKKYLSELLSEHRPLNVAEIANLTRITHRAQFSKMIFVAFSKIVTSKEMKKHFNKGRNELQDVLDSLQEVLEKENIPVSASGYYKIYDIESSPFSEKLMLFFVNTCLGMFCFIMIGQAMNSSLRTDILAKLTKVSLKFRKYYAEGLFLTIENHWLEEPPQAVDRKITPK